MITLSEKLQLNKQSKAYDIEKELSKVNIKVDQLGEGYFGNYDNEIIENVKKYIIDNSLNISDVDTISITCQSSGTFRQEIFAAVRISINDDEPLFGKWILTDKDGNRDKDEMFWNFWTCINNERILKDDHDNEFKKHSHDGSGMIFIYNILETLLK